VPCRIASGRIVRPIEETHVNRVQRVARLLMGAALAVMVATPGAPAAAPAQDAPVRAVDRGHAVARTFSFRDEFTGPRGRGPSPRRWQRQVGGDGWGNDELQTYTGRPANARLDGRGHLVVEARPETYTGTDGITRDYTSARLRTWDAVRFGRVEARIKVPWGQGIWPAFWTLGARRGEVDWPRGGEIDVMEAVNDMSRVFGTIHGPTRGPSESYSVGGSRAVPRGLDVAWHRYAVEWRRGSVTWFLDGRRYFHVQRDDLTPGQQWRLDQPQRLLLNVAVGGVWPGSPDDGTPWPARMLVDWVRVSR
jgi:beta-glucanase (GH16 family)